MWKNKICTLVCGLLLASCNSGNYIASYSTKLDYVKSPSNSKQKFSENKITICDDMFYTYQDSFICAVWKVGEKNLEFTLTNKTDHSIKINWNEGSYVGVNGHASRIMSGNTKYIESNNIQPETVIPSGAILNDVVVPVNKVYFNNGNWSRAYLIPCIYKEANQKAALSYVGNNFSVLLPIIIENVQNDYLFTFKIDKFLEFKQLTSFVRIN